MFGGVQQADLRVVLLLLLFILLIPILALNLLVAMMADTYIDVRSAALNRWSLKQAQYVLSRQRYASLWCDPHFPKMDGGYSCQGHLDDFFTDAASKGEAEDPVENLRKSTFTEAKRAGTKSRLLRHFILKTTKMTILTQDRLGTNIGKTQQKDAFSYRPARRGCGGGHRGSERCGDDAAE
jgi:hypothetical protein